MSAEHVTDLLLQPVRPSDFGDWRARLDRDHVAPVIAVAGSRGKTSVLRAFESILRAGGYRFASWTDGGVEIEGERQRGELGPWSRAMTRLAAGGLDVALQEIDWATIPTIGAVDGPYPIVAVANLCGNSEACMVTPEMLLARKALTRIQSSITPGGRLVLNADDFALANEDPKDGSSRYLVGISPDTPVLRRHIQRGGDACWIAIGNVMVGEDQSTDRLVELDRLAWTQDGRIPFAVQNALLATAIARSCGIPGRMIAAGLSNHDARPESMPGSFNVFDTGTATIVVDRPVPSWFLRATLRGTSNLGAGRQIRVVGPMADVATDDLAEVGRLLGRNGGVLIVHGTWLLERLELLRQGASGNEVPPIFLQASDERRAVQQGFAMLRPHDVLLILAEDASSALRLVSRRLRRQGNPPRERIGAA
jgi:cyanophycin synthetase